MQVYINELQSKFKFRYDWPILWWVMALGLSKFHENVSFPDFFLLFLQILNWKLACRYRAMSYRASSSLVLIDLFYAELWPLDLANFMKMSVFQTFFCFFIDKKHTFLQIMYSSLKKGTYMYISNIQIVVFVNTLLRKREQRELSCNIDAWNWQKTEHRKQN